MPLPDHLQVMTSSKNKNELTPERVLTLVSDMYYGQIDLDPCSNLGEPNVHAGHHYTIEDDGLAHEWHGNVFVNPPYGRGIIDPWTKKAVEEYESGRAGQVIMLLPARTDTLWMGVLDAYPRCYVRGRLRFKGHIAGAPFPSAIVYLGKMPARFADIFEVLGPVFYPRGMSMWR